MRIVIALPLCVILGMFIPRRSTARSKATWLQKKLLLFLSLLIFSAMPLTFSRSTAAAEEQRPYRIAVIIPLTGSQASWGAYARKAIDLAYSDLPPAMQQRIDVIYEDDQFESVKTVSIYQRLTKTRGADAVFVLGSPPANAIGPLCERDRRILMAIGASDPTISSGKNYSFVHWVIPPVLGETLAEELVRRDYQRVAFFASEATGAIADVDAVTGALNKRGLSRRIVGQETFPKGQTDFRATIAALRGKKTDAVVVVLFPGSLAAFAKQYREAGITADLVGMETFEDESEVRAADGALYGKWYVNASDPVPEFVAKYRTRYGEHPGWAAANAFDALMLVARAVEHAGANPHNDAVRDYLAGVRDYHGSVGTYSASGDHRFTLPAALKRVTENGFVPLK